MNKKKKSSPQFPSAAYIYIDDFYKNFKRRFEFWLCIAKIVYFQYDVDHN